jgi:putative Holliday junction resolvase
MMLAGGRAGGRTGDGSPLEPPAGPPARQPAVPPEGRLLAVDWGTKRIGLAVSDPSRTIAQPLATLTRREGRRFPMQQLRAYLDQYHPVGIVVGLPFEADGTEGPAARAARAVAALIAETTGIPVVLEDERMTTALAARADAVGGRVDRDQRAAAVLLQAYLDRARR